LSLDKASAYLATAANSHTSGGFAKVPIDTVTYDTNGIWDSVNKRFVPKKPGYYLITSRVRRNSTNSMVLAIAVSGGFRATGPDVGVNAFAVSGTDLLFCNGTTDYVETYIYSVNAAAYTIGSFDTHMEIIGPF
jgi:hypothetical protein